MNHIKQYAKRIRLYQHFNKAAIVFIGLFALVGTYLLFNSLAASPTASVEPEFGTVSYPASVVSDSNASGGKAIQFNTATASLGKDRYGVAAGCCIQYLTSADLTKQLDDYKAMGVHWLRFDFPWTDIQGGGPTSFNWTRYDAVVNAANARGIKILGTLAYSPSWARPASCSGSDKCGPADQNAFAAYANFAKAAAVRYGPMGVHSWEIWNEENSTAFWQPAPSPANYTQILKQAYAAIKSADPSAIVMDGGTAPQSTQGGNYSEPDWIDAVYQNGGKNYMDVIATHPYCSDDTRCPNFYADWSAWSKMADTPKSIRSVMNANGDSAKKIWGTEFGAPTSGTSTQHYVTETQQAQEVTDGYNLFAGYSWSGVLFIYQYRDNGTSTDMLDHYGMVRYDYTKKPAWQAYLNSVTAAQ